MPVSIEGKDMQPWTLHGPRKHPSIASWQFVQVCGLSGAAGMLGRCGKMASHC